MTAAAYSVGFSIIAPWPASSMISRKKPKGRRLVQAQAPEQLGTLGGEVKQELCSGGLADAVHQDERVSLARDLVEQIDVACTRCGYLSLPGRL